MAVRKHSILPDDGLHLLDEEDGEGFEEHVGAEGGTLAAPSDAGPSRNGGRPTQHDKPLSFGSIPFVCPYKGTTRFLGADRTARWRDERSGKVYREIVGALILPEVPSSFVGHVGKRPYEE